jgi:hypothetical protein
MGGYSLPALIVFGSQLHHFSLSTVSMTDGTCKPQPHQVVFSFNKLAGASGESGCGDVLQVLHVASWHISLYDGMFDDSHAKLNRCRGNLT